MCIDTLHCHGHIDFEQDASFAIEVKVHDLLIEQGINVPKVIYFEHKNNLVGLSLMIVEEIAGSIINDNYLENKFEHIFFDAGKQIALINQIKVQGFSWINRKSHDAL